MSRLVQGDGVESGQVPGLRRSLCDAGVVESAITLAATYYQFACRGHLLLDEDIAKDAGDGYFPATGPALRLYVVTTEVTAPPRPGSGSSRSGRLRSTDELAWFVMRTRPGTCGGGQNVTIQGRWVSIRYRYLWFLKRTQEVELPYELRLRCS